VTASPHHTTSIEVRHVGVLCVVELRGPLRYPDATALLRRHCRELIAQGGRFLLLNMLEVPFMDSSGIGEIVACYKRLREQDGQVKLILQKPSFKLFTYTHLEKMFEIFETEEDAIASFDPSITGQGS
jgi:anti-sigma B factor antagonist